VVTVRSDLDLADLQGNILRGYGKQYVRHLVLTVASPAAARRWLSDAVSGDESAAPQITSAEPWAERRARCVNLGVTHAGLAALGVSRASLNSFPHEFVAGMAARNVVIGDTGPSDPSNWKEEWRRTEDVHLMISVYADDAKDRSAIADRILSARGAFRLRAALDGEGFPGGVVHFGYRDSIAQPQFYGVHDPDNRRDDQPFVEVGAMLLGHATPIENLCWEVPQPNVLGHNGSFNAFRVLEQQVEAFEDFLTACADALMKNPVAETLLPAGAEAQWDPPMTRHAALREMVAAKMLGRWRNGVPLALSPTSPSPQPRIADAGLNNYGYAADPDGQRCPIGSHTRRSNPRDAKTVQRNTNHARRLVRRGIPYGPQYDPANPVKAERGLLGSFMCASLTGQFEAIQYDWTNLGLQDPRITGSNDPILGNNDPLFSRFSFPVGDNAITFRGFARFIQTKGGAYLFQPSMSAIRHLASLSGARTASTR
jgi:deferrochelatase/peroxidase EfeB